MFDYAVLYGDIKINPAAQVPMPKRGNKKDERQVFLTAEDAQKMLDAFKSVTNIHRLSSRLLIL